MLVMNRSVASRSSRLLVPARAWRRVDGRAVAAERRRAGRRARSAERRRAVGRAGSADRRRAVGCAEPAERRPGRQRALGRSGGTTGCRGRRRRPVIEVCVEGGQLEHGLYLDSLLLGGGSGGRAHRRGAIERAWRPRAHQRVVRAAYIVIHIGVHQMLVLLVGRRRLVS